MLLALRSGICSILRTFQQTEDRREAHHNLQPLLQELSGDRQFVFDAFRHFLTSPGALSSTRLTVPLFETGDIEVALHIFAPLRDGAQNIVCDNIHHHGWRLLTSRVICGGYHFIDFLRRSHENRDGDAVLLRVERISDHMEGQVRLIDSYTPHVVFRPDAPCCTLGVWSADQIRFNQNVKRHLSAFPRVRRAAVRTAHLMRLGHLFGLNAVRGLYFRPERGRIIEATGYKTPDDGEPHEVLACILRVMQRVGFDDDAFLKRISSASAPEVSALINAMLSRKEVPGASVWGDWRQRFSETQILQAVSQYRPIVGCSRNPL